jgi:hypothetical protein
MHETRGHTGGRARRRKRAYAGAALVCALSAVATEASAQGPVPIDAAHMREDMHSYFRGEKIQAPFFFGTGVAAGAIGAVLLTRDDPMARGAAYPLIGIGLLQAIVGAGLFFRTDGQVAKLDEQLTTNPAGFKTDEAKRMLRIKNQFIAIMVLESVFILGGTVTASMAARRECCRTLQGVSLGFIAQGAATLMLDLIATARSRDYLQSLQSFDPALAPAPPPGGRAPMSFGPITFGGTF